MNAADPNLLLDVFLELEAEQVLRLEVDQAAEVEVLPVEEDLVDEHLAVAGLVDVLLAVEALVVLPPAVGGLAGEG